MHNIVYLDHAAATPVSEKVLAAMLPYMTGDKFYNPGAAYLPAVQVRREYEQAKDRIAHAIGGKGSEILMTAGATESINLAFTAVGAVGLDSEILVSEIEHKSVMEAARNARSDFRTIRVTSGGIADLDDLRKKITPRTRLISVALVNGELGTVQPLSDIAAMVRAERERRLAIGDASPLWLHSDASQGVGLLDVHVARLGVDMLTLNAAKVYGPKQVGALWARAGIKLQPIVVGGGQESGLRSGTENVAGAVGLAMAIEEAERTKSSELQRVGELKTAFIASLYHTLHEKAIAEPKKVAIIGEKKRQLASFIPLTITGIDAERLVFALENRSVLVGTGAACAASRGEHSHVLRAIGLSDEQIAGSLRITLGKLNTLENTKRAAEIIAEEIAKECHRQFG